MTDAIHNRLKWTLLQILLATGCSKGIQGKMQVETGRGASKSATALKVNPLAAKPGETISISGKSFSLNKDLIVRVLSSKNGEFINIPLKITSSSNATFSMPEDLGLGLKSFEIFNGGETQGSFTLISDHHANSLPILIADASNICSDIQYIDKNGETKNGTRSCSINYNNCSSDGQSSCVVDGVSYIAAAVSSLTASNIKSGRTIGGITGSFSGAFSNCSADGGAGCIVDGSTYKAAKLSNFDTTKIISGTTIAGVAGSATAEAHSNCNSDGSSGCVVDGTSYKAANMTNVTAGNVKSGVTIAGVAGDYPSSTYPLPGASGTADLDAATFNAKVKSSTAFEYWDSSGSRQTGAGDADIAVGNIANGVDIFNTTGTYSGTAPDAWDLRAGVTVSGVTGKLKINCRSGATLATLDHTTVPVSATVDTTADTLTANSHGFSDGNTVRIFYGSTPAGLNDTTTYFVVNSTANTIQLAATSGGSVIDITGAGSSVYVFKTANTTADLWDTIDDYNGLASTLPTYSGWSSNNFCGGVEASVGDANVWVDVTTTNGTTSSTCAATSANCSYKDKISNQEWSKPDMTSRNWIQAYSYCDALTYNGKTDWRLPTQKELMEAYMHGMVSTAGLTNWMTLGNFRSQFWTATTEVQQAGYAYRMNMSSGSHSSTGKTTNTIYVLCVRP